MNDFPFKAFSMDDLPPELQAQIKADLDRRQMESEETSMAIENFIEGLDQEGLRAITLLMGGISSSESPVVKASFYAGMFTGMYEQRHSECMVHGVNHKEESLKANDISKVSTDTRDRTDTTLKVDTPEVETPWQTKQRQMDEFNIKPREDGPGYLCRNCQYYYSSIDDRMLKAPNDCPGCYIKSAHG